MVSLTDHPARTEHQPNCRHGVSPGARSTVEAYGKAERRVSHVLTDDHAALEARLAGAGFVAAREEAGELLSRAEGDPELLDSLVARRLDGEPLAWITGSTSFCGLQIRVDQGVYVPRWQSQDLARRAVARLPTEGTAIDVCTGSGAVAKVLTTARPRASVVATDIDSRAVACASANGLECYVGDLFAPLPQSFEHHVDVIVGVVPYVPTEALEFLSRDTFEFESTLSYEGGPDGTRILRRVLEDGVRFLMQGGAVLLELGGDQAELLSDDLRRLGYGAISVLNDEDGDVRGIEATLN